jgi:hypothetical protein
MKSCEKPHKAVIMLTIEVHELDEKYCSGRPLNLEPHGIKSKEVIVIEGSNQEELISKLRDRITYLRK